MSIQTVINSLVNPGLLLQALCRRIFKHYKETHLGLTLSYNEGYVEIILVFVKST